MRIGIDVGGTNTDAVLMAGTRVVHALKVSTTAGATTGVRRALWALLAETAVAGGDIEAVMIGTTHFLNAVMERARLAPVAALRISLPAAAQVKPFADWPPDLRGIVEGASYMVRGGHEVDGRAQPREPSPHDDDVNGRHHD